MSNIAKLPIEKQAELIGFFSPLEIATLHGHFKLIFRMASFETNSNLGETERAALFSLYHLVEILDEIKNSN